MQKWPRPRGRPKNPTTRDQNQLFKERNTLAKYAPGEDQWMAIEIARNSPLYPRDLLMSAMAGRLIETVVVDGQRYTAVAVRDDISADLDLIGGTVPGTLLMRGPDIWQGLVPGAVSEVPTSQGPALELQYQPGGGAGSGGFTANAANFAVDPNAFATKGNPYAVGRDVTIRELGCLITAVATQTYRGRVWVMDNTNTITALAGDTGAITGLASTRQTLIRPLSPPAVLLKGQRCFVAWSRTDALGISSVPIHGSQPPRELTGFPEAPFVLSGNQNNFSLMTVINPGIGTVVPISGNGAYHLAMLVTV